MRSKKRREQLELGIGGNKPTGRARTLEVNCSNWGTKFVAYYGNDEENVETIEVKSCGLCHGQGVQARELQGRDEQAYGAGPPRAAAQLIVDAAAFVFFERSVSCRITSPPSTWGRWGLGVGSSLERFIESFSLRTRPS